MKKEMGLFVMVLLVLTPFCMAQEQEFKGGIDPSSPFYGIDRFVENMRLALTFNQEQKVNLQLKFADERVGEIESMVKKENQDGVERAIEEKNKIMEGIEKEGIESSEQIKEQIRERLEIQKQEMVRIKNEHTAKEGVLFENLRNEIDTEIQKTNSLKLRMNR